MNEEVAILGAGHQGLAMAAYLGAHGVKCALWNRTEANIQCLLNKKTVKSTGILEGEFAVDTVTTDIAEAVRKVILITTPSSAHASLAHQLADLVDETYTIILNPGRTFGLLDFLYQLKSAGCNSLPVVAEAQTIVFTCRRDVENGVKIYALKPNVPVAAHRIEEMERVLGAIPECIRCLFSPAKSYFDTSLGNVGMILHCAPVLMNVGWIEHPTVNFEYYYEGITQSVADLLEKLDAERLAVAKKTGHPVESLIEWLVRCYGTTGSNLYEHLQSNKFYRGIDAPTSIEHRYLDEDVPNGLVPLEDLGAMMGVPTPVTTIVINFANVVKNCDYRSIGRRYSVLKEIEDDEK